MARAWEPCRCFMLSLFVFRRQMWMWSQGDAYRSRRKEVAMEKEKYRERHHSVTNLLSGVDDMRIHDAMENDNRFSNYDNVSPGVKSFFFLSFCVPP